MLHDEKTFNTFESVRRNKLGKKIELIITWVDISETPGSFNRVLLSLVDITHLRKVEKELKKHQDELELLVQEKTEDLESANEELKSSNEELFEKNDIINNQNNELKVTLQHLQETQAQLLQSEKMASLGILTAGVAHEINNPLNYILGAYEGFKSIMEDSSDPKIVLLLNALKTGIERVSNIVNSLNQFSRSNSTSNEKCDVHEIIDNCLVMLENKLKYRIEIKNEFTPEPVIILGNVGELHQVFLNILSNAEQAIEDKGEISITTSIKQEKLNIEINDTGCGMTKENLNKVTDPFFTTKDPGKGTGLGLSITYNIIREHGGTLDFNSELNKGTTATVILPIK
jgi:signal transduction histidine kinase